MTLSTSKQDPAQPRWHALELTDVFTHLNSSPTGLTPDEAAKRLSIYGPNELQAAARVSP